MYTVRVTFLLLQLLAVVEANVHWTLHSSCYRTKDGQNDDRDLEKAMINAVKSAKAWAQRGSEKLKDSIEPSLFSSTKTAIKPLLNKDNKYADNAKQVADKFDELSQLDDDPTGQNSGTNPRYEASAAWISLNQNTDHYRDFLIVCRPSLQPRSNNYSPKPLPWDRIRRVQIKFENSDLEKMEKEENDPGDWNKITGKKIQAITQGDRAPDEERTDVAETITFHPLWLEHHRNTQFKGWTDKLFAGVTHKNAIQVYSEIGENKKPKVDIRPIDGLLDSSITKTIFHEFFHLSAFGRMKDNSDPYAWANNVKDQDLTNPDLYAIIAAVIELLNRDGDKYKVAESGAVSKKFFS